MSRTRLEWANWMAEKGIVVFEITENSKRPIGGHSWYTRQTTNPQQIAEWFEATPNMNYGLHLGEQYAVIDLDLKPTHNGVEEFEKICAENGIEDFRHELPTLMSRTPSGGYHIFVKVPHPCANKNYFPSGIDVRGAIGYVVGPGSVDSRGEWKIIDPDMPIMDIPEWLLEYVAEPGRKDPNHETPLTEWDQEENITQAMDWLKRREPALEGSNGDDHTYQTCCVLRDFGISEGLAFELLNESGWNERCEPSWGATELAKKLENSYSFAQNRPGIQAVTYKEERFLSGRPAGGYNLTDAQVAEMFRTKVPLELVVDNTVEDDPDIPTDVIDDEDDLLSQFKEETQLWYGFEDFAAIEQVREYIIKGWLIAHGVTGLLAKRGTGKSTIALDLACHLATDRDWWGIPAMKDWGIIYICGEDDEGMILNCRAWAQYHGEEPSNDRFLIAKGIIKMTDRRELRLRLREMKEWAQDRRCLIILDTWARATSGYSSNTQEEMDLAYENAEAVASALNGPMIACFHPPKDGRMTIRGSAVQEDASSGIWNLEDVADGIQLRIQRAKGRGEGNYRKFKIEKVSLPGKDFYGDPLEGIVPVKIGGTEDEHKPEQIEKIKLIRRAWAEAVVGCAEFPMQDNEVESIIVKGGMVRKTVADMITQMWRGYNTGDNEAKDFVIQYMSELMTLEQVVNIEKTDKAVERQLDIHFFNNPDRTPIKFASGIILQLARKINAKGVEGKEYFVVGKKEPETAE